LELFLSYKFLIIATIAFGLAPFFPEPHLVEKLRMLFQGNLSRPIDIFDLIFHIWPILFLIYKLTTDVIIKK